MKKILKNDKIFEKMWKFLKNNEKIEKVKKVKKLKKKKS